MRPIASLLLLLTLPAVAGEPVIIDPTGTKDGTYYYSLVIKDGQVTSITPLTRVVKVGDTLPTTPPGDPNPSPTTFRQGIQLLTKQTLDAGGSKLSAAALSAVYSLASEKVPDADPSQILDLISTLSNLATRDDRAKWDNWRTQVGKALAQLQRDDVLKTKTEYVAALQDIHLGIDGALGVTISTKALAVIPDANNAGILQGFLDPEKLQRLIDLIKLFIQLFELFKPK